MAKLQPGHVEVPRPYADTRGPGTGITDPVTTDADLMQGYDPLAELQAAQHAARQGPTT